MSRLLHHSNQPLTNVYSMPSDRQWLDYKPVGLWVSVEGEGDWKQWCQAESYQYFSSSYTTEVILCQKAKICRIVDAEQLDAFNKSFGRGRQGVDWKKVAKKYQGIIIAPYIWERRLSIDCNWYYAWDCASGCIWDAEAVESVHDITKETCNE